MGTQMWRGGLRFATVGDGGPSVVMGGLTESLLLSAMILDMNHQVVKLLRVEYLEHLLYRQGLFCETSNKLNASVYKGC